MVNQIDANGVILQMRALAARMQANTPATEAQSADKPAFSNVLKQTLDEVNSAQQKAANMANAFERGDPSANIADVMIAIQKAEISFQTVTQVRNRLVSAYQEVMNMPM
ncbi:MAG: flagellar hook-basal body complex protein FliE [Gammaproteobacteria bacterium]|nr:flagellar hook-basal body complex protein FliE [Gammaproteobacteria bacterium]